MNRTGFPFVNTADGPLGHEPVPGRLRTEELVLAANGQRLAATKVCPWNHAAGCGPSILTLHGLGPTATRHSIRYVQDHLAEHGHRSMSFEFSGNGDSTGVLAESSLRRRRAETLAAAGYLSKGEAPVLIGTSMGAHIAAWTVPELRPRALVLFCPAAYPQRATDLRFDENFARPGDYAGSPAYSGIAKFHGDLLVIGAKNDQVVPPAVIEGYVSHARNAHSSRVIWLDDCDHFVHRWLPRETAAQGEVLHAILQLVSADQEIQ